MQQTSTPEPDIQTVMAQLTPKQLETYTELRTRNFLSKDESEWEQKAFEKVRQERRFQDSKFGINWSLTDQYFLAILVEEVGEVARAIQAKDRIHMCKELAQVAAVCVRWMISVSTQEAWARYADKEA